MTGSQTESPHSARGQETPLDPHGDGLLRRALAGDTHAFSLLCEQRRQRLWRIVTSVARGADAEDLVQEAVVRAYRALHTYSGQAPFDAWLCRIALNVAHDHVRSAWKRRVFCFDPLTPPTPTHERVICPEGEVELRDLQRRVREAVARLPEPQRVPIWLHYFEGFTVVDVARLEKTPEATVRSRLRAGLRRLELSLGDLLPENTATMETRLLRGALSASRPQECPA